MFQIVGKTSFAALALFISLAPVYAQNMVDPDGGNSGGGGGGICTPQRCHTLAETGLRLNPSRRGFVGLELAQRIDLETVIASLPARLNKERFLAAVIGDDSTYIHVEAGDVRRYNRFHAEYVEILRSSSFRWPEQAGGNFELLAVSSREKTYLLPGFDRLSTRGKSLLLIHEALIRTYGVSVRNALSFDGVMLDYLSAGTSSESNPQSGLLVRLMEDLSLIRLDNVNPVELVSPANVARNYELTNNRRIALQDCLLKSDSDRPCVIESEHRTSLESYGSYDSSAEAFLFQVSDRRTRNPKQVFTVLRNSNSDLMLGCASEREAKTQAVRECLLSGCRGSCAPVQDVTSKVNYNQPGNILNFRSFNWIVGAEDSTEQCLSVAKVACVP